MRSDRLGVKQSVLHRSLLLRCMIVWCMIALSAGLLVRRAIAQPLPANEEVPFDIDAQPLADALVGYARIAGVEILMDDGIVAGRRSDAISGTFHPTVALRRMLANTGLEIRYVDRGTITLVPHHLPNGDAGDLDDRYASFTVALQAAVAQTMCSYDGPLPGSGRVTAQLWIAPSGAVARTLMLASDGNDDAAIVRRLDTLKVGQAPPAGLPQPATIVFARRNAADCVKHAGRLP